MNTERRVLRYEIPIDDQPHPVPLTRVLMVSAHRQGLLNRVELWLDVELDAGTFSPVDEYRDVQVFGTGQIVPVDAEWLGSCRADPLVWHVFGV